jgi:hypothetical protein
MRVCVCVWKVGGGGARRTVTPSSMCRQRLGNANLDFFPALFKLKASLACRWKAWDRYRTSAIWSITCRASAVGQAGRPCVSTSSSCSRNGSSLSTARQVARRTKLRYVGYTYRSLAGIRTIFNVRTSKSGAKSTTLLKQKKGISWPVIRGR